MNYLEPQILKNYDLDADDEELSDWDVPTEETWNLLKRKYGYSDGDTIDTDTFLEAWNKTLKNVMCLTSQEINRTEKDLWDERMWEAIDILNEKYNVTILSPED